MQIIKSYLKLVIFLLPIYSKAQSTYITQGAAKELHLMDRLEIKHQYSTNLLFTGIKPYSRQQAVRSALLLDSIRQSATLSSADAYNLNSLYINNMEWLTNISPSYWSKKPFLHTFFQSPADFYQVNNKDFFLSVNPVLQIKMGKESGNDQTLFLNARGVTIRGCIANKIGFSTTLTDNQERGPLFYQQEVKQLRAVPGNGFYKVYKNDPTAQDYFDARGYLTFNAAKSIDIQFGYDKNFIGNGYRSLFLSDWGNSYLFAKINTRIWKLNYQNLYMELMPQFTKRGDSLLPRKYTAMHHLSMNVTKWLNIGLFEGVIFGRKDHFDFQYLNPIIFYRHIEGTVGSPDNAVAGIDFKANVYHRFQFYGQLLLDEFIVSKIRNQPTSWVNKFGIQLGGKYIDAFGIKNLDLQGEINRVRPFTYSHNDTISNYTHYNQPLAHPLGANFQECIAIVRYQPFPKWNIQASAQYYVQGLDTANANFGGNIFKSYLTRLTDEGYKIGSGNKATCLNTVMTVSYEWKQNLFLEAGIQRRSYHLASTGVTSQSTLMNLGIRWNVHKRVYDF